MNFVVLWLFTKVFTGGVASFAVAKESNQRKFFFFHIFNQFAKVFSLESFLLYSILH